MKIGSSEGCVGIKLSWKAFEALEECAIGAHMRLSPFNY